MKYERYIWFIDKSMTTHQFVRACDLQFLKKKLAGLVSCQSV